MKKQKGITIIALIITIILMLILATISVNVAINGGLFEKASDAVSSTEIANEKDTVLKANIIAKSKSKVVTVEDVQKALNSITGPNVTTVLEDIDTFLVKFNESNRFYEIFNTGNVEYLGKLKEKPVTLECVDSTGKVVANKPLTILRENYSIKLPQVDGYEPSVETLIGEIGDSEKIQALYYQIFQDDTTLVFTGLDSSGNITTDEASIVSYMIGSGATGFNNSGNGIKVKNVLGILKIPDNYKGKPVTQIAGYSCDHLDNIIQVIIGKNITSINNWAFYNNKSINKVTFYNDNLDYLGELFGGCYNWTQIEIAPGNLKYKLVDNIIYSADGKKLIKCPNGRKGEFIIPDTVEIVGNSAFRGTNLTKITVSDNVTTLDTNAFFGSSTLQEIIIGRKVTNFGNLCFFLCSQLKTVTHRNGIHVSSAFGNGGGACNMWTEIKTNPENTDLKAINNILYSYNEKKLIRVPIGKEADEFVIPDSVETIEEGAFFECKKIKCVKISKNVTEIIDYAFGNNESLETIIIDSETIASGINHASAQGRVIYFAETIYIKDGITPGGHITDTTVFKEEESDKEGYVKYVRIS